MGIIIRGKTNQRTCTGIHMTYNVLGELDQYHKQILNTLNTSISSATSNFECTLKKMYKLGPT